MSDPHSRIIFPLDVDSSDEAHKWCKTLEGRVGIMKVGLELFTACGPAIFNVTHAYNFDVMLDLKLLDIPETVEKAVLAAGKHRVKFLTVHVGQRAMMERAAKAAEDVGITLLGVTVLTSMVQQDLLDLGYSDPTGDRDALGDAVDMAVRTRVYLGRHCGLKGFVGSPQEVALLRELAPEATLVVPGVRPAGAALNDQKRVATPAKAMEDGADYLVVGRPIRNAPNPVAAAQGIAEEIRPFA